MRYREGEKASRLPGGSRHDRSLSPASERRSLYRNRRNSPEPKGRFGSRDRYRPADDVRSPTGTRRRYDQYSADAKRGTDYFYRSRSRSRRRASPYPARRDTRRRYRSPAQSSAPVSWSNGRTRGRSGSPYSRHRKAGNEERLHGPTKSKAAPAIATIGSRASFRRAAEQTVQRCRSESQEACHIGSSYSVASEKPGTREGRPRRPEKSPRDFSRELPQRTDSTEDREGQIARACMKDVEAEERQCEGELRLSRSRSPRQAPAVKSPDTSRRVPRVESEERSSGGGVACMSRHSKAREGYEPNAGVEALMQEVSHPDEGDPPQTAGKGVSPGPENESAAKARDPGLVADETESALDRQSLSAPPTTVAEAAAFQDYRSSAKSGTVCERTASVRDLHDQRKAEQQDLRDMNRAFGGVGRGPHERRALAPGAPCAMRSDEGDPSGSAVEAHCTRGSESLREKMGHNRGVFRDDAVLRGLNMRDAQRATTELLGRGRLGEPMVSRGRPRPDHVSSTGFLRPPFPVGRLYDATSRPRAFSGQLRQGYQDGGGGVPSPGSLARPPPFLPQRPHTVVRSNATCTLARGHEVPSIPRPLLRASRNERSGRQEPRWRHDMYEQIAHEPEKSRRRFNLYGESLEVVD